MKTARRPDVRFSLLVVCVAVLFWTAIGSNVIGMAKQRDFLNLYTGGLLARTGQFSELYSYELQSSVQDSLLGKLPLHMPFVRPPFYALVLAPLSLIPVHAAFPVWIGLQCLMLAGVWVWAWRRFGPDALVYCSFFLPTALGIAHGQDCVVLLLIMLGTWTLMERGRDDVAGLVLSLSLFKFHLFLLLPLAILLRRRWKLFGGYCTGGIALALLSMALGGFAGVRGYVHLLTRKDLETLSPSPEMMVGVNSMAVNLGLDHFGLKVALAGLLVGVVVWTALKTTGELRWFWTAIFGGMLLSPHTYEYDLSSLMVPMLLLVFGGNKWERGVALAGLVPLSYFCTVAGAPWAIAPSAVMATVFVTVSGIGESKAQTSTQRLTEPSLAARG